jgi:hypothetical protein
MPIKLPITTDAVAHWLLVLSILYVLLRCGVAYLRNSRIMFEYSIVSDAVCFSGSVLLALGIWYHPVMIAIGDLTAFLIVASLGGLVVTVRALMEEGGGVPRAVPAKPQRLDDVLPDNVVAAIVKVVRDADREQ